jgi:hypothetical protein
MMEEEMVSKTLGFCPQLTWLVAQEDFIHKIQSMPPNPTFLISILILSSHLCLGLPSGLFPSGFPTKMQLFQILTIRYHCMQQENTILQ